MYGLQSDHVTVNIIGGFQNGQGLVTNQFVVGLLQPTT